MAAHAPSVVASLLLEGLGSCPKRHFAAKRARSFLERELGGCDEADAHTRERLPLVVAQLFHKLADGRCDAAAARQALQRLAGHKAISKTAYQDPNETPNDEDASEPDDVERTRGLLAKCNATELLLRLGAARRLASRKSETRRGEVSRGILRYRVCREDECVCVSRRE